MKPLKFFTSEIDHFLKSVQGLFFAMKITISIELQL